MSWAQAMSKGLTEGDEGFPWDRHVGRTVAVLCVVGRCALGLGMIVSEERDERSRQRHPERFGRNLNVDLVQKVEDVRSHPARQQRMSTRPL